MRAGSIEAWALRLFRGVLVFTERLDGDEWVDQRQSPLAAHCSTVVARLGAGLPGAKVDGDRYLLSTAALAEEMINGAT